MWNTHSYINEYIRFADQKASMLIGVNSAVIGAMVWSELQKIQPGLTFNFVTLLVTLLLLVVSFSLAWFAMYPRLLPLNKSKSEASSLSPIFFEDIRLRKKDNYTNHVFGLSEIEWMHAIAQHCWELSDKVAHRKFFWIGISARLWLVASIMALILIVANHP